MTADTQPPSLPDREIGRFTIIAFIFSSLLFCQPGLVSADKTPPLSIKVVDDYRHRPGSSSRKNPDETAPLVSAMEMKRNKEAIQLIVNGADVQQKDAYGLTSLMYAARYGNAQIVDLLLERGAEINVANHLGRTPLIEAIINNHRKITDKLIVSGATLKPFPYQSTVHTDQHQARVEVYGKNTETLLPAGGSGIYPGSGFVQRSRPEILEKKLMTLDPLSASIRGGHDEMVEYLLATYYDYETNKDQIDAALRVAAGQKNGTKKIIKLLLNNQATVNGWDSKHFTPLMRAASRGNSDIIDLLLARGAAVDAVSARGDTPLLLAIRKGKKDVVAILLENGASTSSLAYTSKPSKPVQHTSYPFEFAVRRSSQEMALFLLDQETELSQERLKKAFSIVLKKTFFRLADKLIGLGADVNMHVSRGEPLLNAIVGAWKLPEKTVRYLCERGALVNARDREGRGLTPLHHAVKRRGKAIAVLLLKHGADINSRSKAVQRGYNNYDGTTPLITACSPYSREMVHFLLEKGADPNISNKQGAHPLNVSKILADPATVQLLLDHHADPNGADHSRNPPLFLAVTQSKNIASVRLLLQYGADPNHQGTDSRSLHPAKTSPLKVALRAENLEAAKLLLAHGADIRAVWMREVVVEAMVKENEEIVRFLAESGAELNDVKGSSRQKWLSPLMYAAQLDHLGYLQLFLDNGAEVNLQSEAGDTALIHAATAGSGKSLQFLLSNGAGVNIQNSSGDTALLKAIMTGNLENVNLLLAHGANPSVKNREGLTPYWIAKRKGNQNITDTLIAHGAEALSYMAFTAKMTVLQATGILPSETSAADISPQQLDFYLTLIGREFGIKKPEFYHPDPRLSSPVRTWETHKQALLKSDLPLFKKTVTHPDGPLVDVYEQITPEKRREMAEEMRPIANISQDNKKAKFRIHRFIDGEDITFYIYFSRVFGEWKIDEY